MNDASQSQLITRVLLSCGIASSLLYAAITAYVATQWDSYSSLSQTVSELSAIGAPTRSLWSWVAAPYTPLLLAFGCGVWRSSGSNRPLRISAVLLLLYGALGFLWPFAPMHLRPTLAAGGGTFSDTMHIALATASVLLMFCAISFGAAAFGTRFRIYSIITMFILAGFGVLTFLDAPNVGANLPTPWVGLWERINIGVFLLWVILLALVLLQHSGDTARKIAVG